MNQNAIEASKAIWQAYEGLRQELPSSQSPILHTIALIFLKVTDELSSLSQVHRGIQFTTPTSFPSDAHILGMSIGTDVSFPDKKHYTDCSRSLMDSFLSLEKNNHSSLLGLSALLSFNSFSRKQANPLARLLNAIALHTPNNVLGDTNQLELLNSIIEHLLKHQTLYANEQTIPESVASLMCELLEPQDGESIVDPFMLRGELLNACAKSIKGASNSETYSYSLSGQEAKSSHVLLAKLQLLLQGERNIHLEAGDAIRMPHLTVSPWELKKYDLAVSFPPIESIDWGVREVSNDPFNRFERGLPPKFRGGFAYIFHMLKSLNYNGRMGVVMPHGVLSRGGGEHHIRQRLIEDNLLDSVISLPYKMLSNNKLQLVLLLFKQDKKDDSILFIDASQSFKSIKSQKHLSDGHIEKIVTTYQSRESISGYAHLANIEEIIANDFNLSIARYIEPIEVELSTIDAYQERNSLLSDLAFIQSDINESLSNLGAASTG